MRKLKELIEKCEKKVRVDNDFERAYNIPFEEFETIDRKDLIELLFLYKAILDENEIDNY